MDRDERDSGLKLGSNLSEPRLNGREQNRGPSKVYEERQQSILEGIEEGYVEVDLKGNTVFCNDSFCRITGYPRQELLELNYREYMDEAMAKRVFAAFNKVFRTQVPEKAFHYEIIRKDKAKRVIENSISLVKNCEGHRVGFRSVVRDITHRKRTEEELEKHRKSLQAIFRSVRDAIITVDTNMVGIEANEATNSICGISPENIIGEIFTECRFRCDKSCHEVLRNSLGKKIDIKEYKVQCRHRDRPEQKAVVTSSPLLGQDGSLMGTVFLIRDITRLSTLERELRERHQFQNIIGKSKKIQDVYALLEDLANLDTTVLITGETGTGKSLVARALHYGGGRAFEPLITVNCSALPENLLESELFGHVKGAFTGAIKDTPGRFQAAHGGSIHLDEIGDISPTIQLKLLRVLQEKEFERLGESFPRKIDVRVIATTNRDLREKMRLGEFREDLYYRLKVMEVKLPPLRERLDDIPLLVNHFCSVFRRKFGKNIESVSDEVLGAFLNYSWPGNVRELEHSLEHAFILCHGSVIALENIPIEIRQYSTSRKSIQQRRTVQSPEDILMVLEKTDWNKAKASRLLGIDRSTLYRKIRQYRLFRNSESVSHTTYL